MVDLLISLACQAYLTIGYVQASKPDLVGGVIALIAGQHPAKALVLALVAIFAWPCKRLAVSIALRFMERSRGKRA